MGETFEEIFRRMTELKRENRRAESVTMSNDYWFRLMSEADSHTLLSDPNTTGKKVFGLDVVIDPSLGPNEFEIKYR